MGPGAGRSHNRAGSNQTVGPSVR